MTLFANGVEKEKNVDYTTKFTAGEKQQKRIKVSKVRCKKCSFWRLEMATIFFFIFFLHFQANGIDDILTRKTNLA